MTKNNSYNIIKRLLIMILETMKRRVNIGGSLSELVVVQDWYDAYIEKHLGVPNRNF